VEARNNEIIPTVKDFVIRTLKERHQGEEDVTVITQDAVMATFDKVLAALTFAVGGIAAISLAVAGILIMNVMLIAVSQRTAEIGLLKALGATPKQIQTLFLTEAAMLSLIGALLGLLLGRIANGLVVYLYPALPAATPLWAFLAAVIVALVTGLLFGVLPARRAARLDPVLALAKR
jgi:putative ABC transport system permease protein